MSKRQIRKRNLSSSSDEDTSKVRKASVGRAKASGSTIKTAALSFGEGSGDDGSGDEISLKRTKASRTIKKKMRQAPNISAITGGIEQSLNSSAVTISTGGNYSAESLAALRQSQHFSTAPSASELHESPFVSSEVGAEFAGDDTVLAGDEAVTAADECGENVDRKDISVSTLGVDIQDRIDTINEQQHEKNKKIRFANAIPKADNKEFRELDDPESAQWEEQLLKRAARVGKIQPSAQGVMRKIEQNRTAGHEEIGFDDTLKSLRDGIAKLQESCENNELRISNLKDSVAEVEIEKNSLKPKVEAMNENKEWIEVYAIL